MNTSRPFFPVAAVTLIKARNTAAQQERPAFTRMIADKLAELGYPVEPDQQLPLDV